MTALGIFFYIPICGFCAKPWNAPLVILAYSLGVGACAESNIVSNLPESFSTIAKKQRPFRLESLSERALQQISTVRRPCQTQTWRARVTRGACGGLGVLARRASLAALAIVVKARRADAHVWAGMPRPLRRFPRGA